MEKYKVLGTEGEEVTLIEAVEASEGVEAVEGLKSAVGSEVELSAEVAAPLVEAGKLELIPAQG